MPTTFSLKPKNGIIKGGLKPNFFLYDDTFGAPIIVSPSADNRVQFRVQQTTLTNSDGSLKQARVIDNTLSLLTGTAFTLAVIVVDPDNPKDRSSIENLVFRWYKNGSYLYQVNNQNNFKGSNVLVFDQQNCTPEISGVYRLDIINQSGTTQTNDLTLRVYDTTRLDQLYNNVINNGSGEAGLDGWEVEDSVLVSEFRSGTIPCRNFGSILKEDKLATQENATLTDGDKSIAPIQPEQSFTFSKTSAWVNFGEYYRRWLEDPNIKNDADTKWWYSYMHPNLIPNEDPQEQYACFYPSKRFVDDYNQNAGKLGLVEETKDHHTYFTKGPVQRTNNSTATMTQTIELDSIGNFIDGNVCGVDNIVANFFSYVGLGVDAYQYEVEFKDVFKPGPGDWPLYEGISITIDEAQENASSYFNTPTLQYDLPNDDGNLAFSIAKGPLGFIRNYLSDTAIHTEENASWIINRNESKYIKLNRSIYNYGPDYTPPPWRYPILKELFEESVATGTNSATILVGEPRWGSFRQLYGRLLFADGAAAEVVGTELEGLEALTHPAYRSQNPSSTSRASGSQYFVETMNARFEAVDEFIMTKLVQPLLPYFQSRTLGQFDLAFPSSTYGGRQQQYYKALKALIHLVVSKDRFYEIRQQYGAMGVIRKLKFQDTTNTYLAARTNAENLFSGISDTQTDTNSWYLYYKRMFEFYMYEIKEGVVVPNFLLVKKADPNLTLNSIPLVPQQWKKFRESGNVSDVSFTESDKVDLTLAKEIKLTPLCNNTVSFTFTYIDNFGVELTREIIEGPQVDDIFSVKEKALFATVVGKLLQRTCRLPDELIQVTYKGYAPLFWISKTQITDGTWITNNYVDMQPVIGVTNQLAVDRGAAAFFAIQKKLNIPKRTRSIQVSVLFDHNSRAYVIEPSSGIDRYDLDEIPAEHTSQEFKYYRSGNPRTGVTHMKLVLFDNEFKRTSQQPQYYLPPYHIWGELKRRITAPMYYLRSGDSRGQAVNAPASVESFDYNPPSRQSTMEQNIVKPPRDVMARESAEAAQTAQQGLKN